MDDVVVFLVNQAKDVSLNVIYLFFLLIDLQVLRILFYASFSKYNVM